jgi:hypothetical protein
MPAGGRALKPIVADATSKDDLETAVEQFQRWWPTSTRDAWTRAS